MTTGEDRRDHAKLSGTAVPDTQSRILVLGGYGLIGLEVVRACLTAGHSVTGLGRNAQLGQRLVPQASWIGADLATLVDPDRWRPHLAGIDAVVNASGVLQEGAGDDPGRVQGEAIRALIAACEAAGVRRYVQISAPGAEATADTSFLRSKAEADAALRASGLDWIILKPGLVIGPNAYGGTLLLRMLAGFPLVLPLMLAESRVQTVALSDVAACVAECLAGSVPARRDYDLVESTPHTLAEIVLALRAWLGLPPPRLLLRLPASYGRSMARLGDAAGWLGWRAPLRTTAVRVLEMDVLGDPAPWQAATGKSLRDLNSTLTAMPATLQERLFARTMLAFPFLVATLSLFWVVSGLIGLWQRDAAVALLTPALSPATALGLVIGGSLIDIAVGVGVAVRRWCRVAALASVVVSLAYLAGGTVLAPHLWVDPLGPLVKVLPGITLALAVAALAEER